MARMPGQGVAASIGGPTTPGTATTEVQEQGVPLPPPGLQPPDFTNWSLPLTEAPGTAGLPTHSGGPPGIGRQTVGPRASGQRAPALPMQVQSTPQGTLPVRQPRPSADPEILPWDAQRLRNQVSCMIAEYHLTSSARVSTTLSPVLPEAAKLLLPAIKTDVSNVSFEGTQDVRVLDRAKTLQVAVWLHRLDMAVGGDQSASETLDVSRHCLGCLLESFLIPPTHDLTFREVVAHCLYENQCDAQRCLDNLVRCHNRVRKELDDLVEAHKGASGSSGKRIKKEIDLRRKDLESLKGCISHEESYLQEDMPEQDVPESDDPLDQGAEVVMPPDSGVDDAPSESATAPVSGSSPGEDAAMEVDEGAIGLPPTSPVSREDDDLLDENEAVEVEAGLAHLTVSSPRGQVREGKGASAVEAPPPLEGEEV